MRTRATLLGGMPPDLPRANFILHQEAYEYIMISLYDCHVARHMTGDAHG